MMTTYSLCNINMYMKIVLDSCVNVDISCVSLCKWHKPLQVYILHVNYYYLYMWNMLSWYAKILLICTLCLLSFLIFMVPNIWIFDRFQPSDDH